MVLPSKKIAGLLSLLLGLAFMAGPTMALDERDYERHYREQIVPILNTSTSGVLTASDGYRLTYHVFHRGESRPAVMILTGYGESWLVYGETILDLDHAGYDVYVMDHRGMGFSGRLAQDPLVAHITDFQTYVEDARTFLHQVVLSQARGPLYLLAHSMGGLVGAYLLEKESGRFRAAAFSAPLFELNTGVIPESLALGVVSLQVAFGGGAKFAPGRGDFDPKTVDPAECSTTHSVVRCQHQLELYQRVPESFIAGPSAQWVKEVIVATRRLPDVVPALRDLPVLLLKAEDDAFVRPGGMVEVCSALAHCQLKSVPQTRHEILQEKDPARGFALLEILRLFH